ncbi:hypothetical protein J7426_14410 [Tropicibacter sp. R16_0]|uniref:hypothetical protein n=1 Tax=Tropicibacter sp. R16_0 TaxID=2821102 RepID=UPI001ADA4E0A|nr:hypothetical protein [Tropicibacter sp. R16_0]MBO9451463.1 hypothetical protein [Tropicibacter sp. R16_0]
MSENEFNTTDDGLLVDQEGKALATFVDSFRTLELSFPEATVILLRLYESGSAKPGQRVSARKANQVRMSPATARRLAKHLLSAADEIEGVGAPRQ